MQRHGTSLLAGFMAVIALATPSFAGRDVLYLQDGREITGTLVSMTDAAITFQVDGEAAPQDFPRDQIQRLDLTRQRPGDDAKTAADIQDPVLQRALAKLPSKNQYPDSGYVTLHAGYDYRLDADGAFRVTERRIILILLERGKDEANVARYFKRGDETFSIDFARTIDPDGAVTPISDSGVEIASVHADKPLYDKLQQVKFAMKQVKVGSVVDYQFTMTRPHSDVLYPLYSSLLLRSEEPVLDAVLRYDVPAKLPVHLVPQRLGDNVTQTREEQGDRVIHTFTATNCARVVPEPLLPPEADFLPAVTFSMQMTWEQIGRAFAGACNPARVATPELKAKAAEVTAGKEGTAAAAALYQDFTRTISQQSVRPDQYSYVPHVADDIFRQRAGNCIDKALLASVLYAQAGIPAHMVLVRPQSEGKLIESVPSIRQFSDALLAVEVGGERVFLALNDETVRYGQLPADYQGTRGLLIGDKGGELIDLPMQSPDQEQTATTLAIKVDPSGDLDVTKTQTYTGNAEFSRRRQWKDQKDEERRRSMEVALTTMYPKAKLVDYQIENLDDVNQPLRLVQHYVLDDYAMTAGDDLLVLQLPEVYYNASQVGKPTRDFPLRWYLNSQETKDITIQVPNGFTVYYGGKDFAVDNDLASFEADFETADGTVHYRDRYTQKQLEAPREAYKEFKRCIETRARVPKEWIVLERGAATAAQPAGH